MSTTTTLGVVPKLLPITASVTAPLILLNTYLQASCIRARIATKVFLGDTSAYSLNPDPAARSSVVKDGATGDYTYNDPMLLATTAHRNFLENAPFAILLAGLVELNGGDRRVLGGVMGFFAVTRISHALAVLQVLSSNRFREFGFFGSTLSLLGLSGWGAWLVKGYWGL